MKKTDFEPLYQNIIKPSALKMCKLTGAEFSDVSALVYEEYLKQRGFFRDMCRKHTKEPSDPTSLLDRHKVCAALCIAICKCKMIYKKDTEESNNLYDYHKLNEQLAISSALSALKAYVIADNLNGCDSFAKGFLFPDISHESEEEGYEHAIVRSLYMADVSNQLSLPLLAHIFFLIEKYHELSSAHRDKEIIR